MDTFSKKIHQSAELLKRVQEMDYHYSERSLVFQKGKVKLFRYGHQRKATPLLIVFATVNRPEILDIFPERSFIKGLIDKNQDVYLLDWGYPDKDDHNVSFSDYVSSLQDCVSYITSTTHYPKIHLLGICQGGVISLCLASMSQQIKTLTLISTPIDFHTSDNLVSKFLAPVDIQAVSRATGNIPGGWLTDFFISLRPFELVGQKYLRFLERIDDDAWTGRFLRVEKWLRDGPDQPGNAFTTFVKDCYQENKLIKGNFQINGQTVNLKKITLPVLNIMASDDEIVPVSASRPLKKYISSIDYTTKTFQSGHIGIYVSDKVGTRLSSAIARWLDVR